LPLKAVTALRGRYYERFTSCTNVVHGNLVIYRDDFAVKAVDDYVSWEAIGIRIKNVSSDFKIRKSISVR
jgi:hypothetical protein